MEQIKAALVKKIGEGNKSLSVIVAEDKLAKFKRFSQNVNLSMGYLLNQAIDRYLANNSTEIFSTSIGATTSIGTTIASAAIEHKDMEELVNASIGKHLLNTSIGTLAKTDIEELIKTYIDTMEVDKRVKAEIESLTNLLTELETYTKNQFEAMREELKNPLALTISSPAENREVTTESIAIPVKTADKDSGVKSWVEFFKMIGMDALTATEAQKKENIDTRIEQIEQGLQAAKERGLGEWAVKVVGRSFVRVGD